MFSRRELLVGATAGVLLQRKVSPTPTPSPFRQPWEWTFSIGMTLDDAIGAYGMFTFDHVITPTYWTEENHTMYMEATHSDPRVVYEWEAELDEGYYFLPEKMEAFIEEYAPKDREYISKRERSDYSLFKYRSKRLAEVFQAIEMSEPGWWDLSKAREGLFTVTLNYLDDEDERDRICSVKIEALIERV